MSFPQNFQEIRAQSRSVATDTSLAAKIIYVGPVPNATDSVGGVTMAAWDPAIAWTAHDITFWLDAGTAADALIGTAGVISVDAGAANYTFGQLMAAVNASPNWRMVLVGALHDDNLYVHSGTLDQIIDVVAATANGRACGASDNGTELYFDTSRTNHTTVCIGPESLNGESDGHLWGRLSNRRVSMPRDIADVAGEEEITPIDYWSYLRRAVCNGTFSAGSATVTIYEASQSAYTALFTVDGAATTVDKIVDWDVFGTDVFMASPGKRLLVRLVHGTTSTAASIVASGGIGRLASLQ